MPKVDTQNDNNNNEKIPLPSSTYTDFDILIYVAVHFIGSAEEILNIA